MKEYRPGTAIVIDINALIDNDAHLTFAEVVTDHEEDQAIFTLANDWPDAEISKIGGIENAVQ